MRTVRFEVFRQTPEQVLLRFYGDDSRPAGTRELEQKDVELFAEEVENAYSVSAALADHASLGQRLYDWLDGPTERWLATARQGVPGLAVHVDGEEKLRHLPWELMVDGGAFLCGQEVAPLTPVRRSGKVKREIAIQNRPLRLLFLAASPTNVEPVLSFEDEEKQILEATRKQSIELEVEESGSLMGLKERVESAGAGYFDVLHLTGHANVKDGNPYFLMENELGGLHQASAEEIAAAFVGNWPALVFLSGCKTGQATGQGALPSLCERLIQAGAPAVLGWALPVGDQPATGAAGELYHHLAAGKRIDEAVARARAWLWKEKSPYWHLLRLYTDATPPGELVTPAKTKARERVYMREARLAFLDAGSKREVCPRDRFVGRRRALQRCLRALKSVSGEEGCSEGVLLTGMGGLGKSSLATRLCERMSGHQRFVWVGRMDEQQLLHGLGGQLDDAAALAVLNEPLALKLRLRKLLEDHLATEPALFVFDDFEQNAEREADGSLKLDPQGQTILEPVALGVLSALLAAVHELGSESRVIVTCQYRFPLPGPGSLYLESLETLHGADLNKKVRQLDALKADGKMDAELRERATRLAAGNPRLLERMNAVLADTATDSEAVLAALEGAAEQFREDVLLRKLLDLQTETCRGLLARISVYGLPVDRAALEAVAGGWPLEPHLSRAAALGLVESTQAPGEENRQYFVSELLAPLLAAELASGERKEVCARAARQLYQVWWVALERTTTEERALEIHRLAMLGEEKEVAVRVADAIASRWYHSSRFREAELLCRATLQLGEDFRVLHALANAESVLGNSVEALEHYEQALTQCPPYLPGMPEECSRQRAQILHNIATQLAQQGELQRALELWAEAQQIQEATADEMGKAATFHGLATALAQQGDISRARQLWELALSINEAIGNTRAIAVIVGSLARINAQQGDTTDALQLWERALRINVEMNDEQGKATNLHNMGCFLAQRDSSRAFELWNQSLRINQATGNALGQAANLHNMADALVKQGRTKLGLELWNQSLQINERIGNIKGKAITQAEIALALGDQGNAIEERRLNLEAAAALASIRAWLDLGKVLKNLGSSGSNAPAFLAQAFWLTLRIQVPLQATVNCAFGLCQEIGFEAEAAPRIAAAAVVLSQSRGENHPEREQFQQTAVNLLGQCAQARQISKDGFQDWIEAEGLLDPQRLFPALTRDLEALAGDSWLFDRSLVAPAGPA